MILASSIINKVKADLDAEGSDYYRDDQDYIPAINKAIDWVVAVVNMGLGEKKISEEAFRDLTKVKIYQTNTFSRILLPALTQTDEIWTLIAVLPLPVAYPNSNSIVPSNDVISYLRGELSLQSSQYIAERVTSEELEINRDNPFFRGHALEPGELVKTFCYLAPQDYQSSSYVTSGTILGEITIFPEISKKLVAIRYAKYPTRITSISDNIEFPKSMENIIYLKALNYIGIKQGDQSTIINTSNADLRLLLSAFQ